MNTPSWKTCVWKAWEVVFNGEWKGIFALEEFFAKEMIEAQGRREGLFLVSDEDLRWRRRAQAMEIDRELISLFDLPGYHDRLFRTYGSGRIARSPKLSRERDEAVSLLRSFQEDRLEASKVFDVDLVARYLALAELWSVAHGLRSINSVFYFNPITARLEPVAFDALPMSVPRSSDPGDLFALQDDEWTSRALEDVQLMAAYLDQVRRVSTDEYLGFLREKIGAGIKENTMALHREWPDLNEPWPKLAQRQRILRAILDPPRTVQALYGLGESSSRGAVGPERGPGFSVQVANITRLPTEVLAFRAGGKTIAASQALANPSDAAFVRDGSSSVVLKPKTPGRPARYVDFSLAPQLELRDGESLVVLNRVLGEESVRETPMTRYPSIAERSSLPHASSVEEVLARHPFLESAPDGSGLRVRSGDWTVEGDLILPEGLGLEAGPGTTLRFDRDAVLLARGPLRFRGEPDRPIVLGPKEGSWGGVVVVESDAASLWEHVTIEKTRGVERGGWILTGGITFYASPIELSRVRISGSEAEDAINIIRTRFEFREVEIFDTQSDAFDGDFTRGAIFRSSFHDIAGDAIDVSGSLLEIQDVHASDVGDKGISVGEVSQVTVSRFEARGLGIGLASKDRSEVTIADSSIKGFRHAGLAAYSKKPEFGPAQIRATNVVLQDGPNPTLIQEGSWIDRDGTVLTGSALDVKELYAAGILGN
jgi:hypothetical protein